MIPIIDLHCHPTIKIFLFNKNISVHHHPWSDLIPFGMHVDLPGMQQSNVKVAMCSHYIPEADFGNLKKSQKAFKVLQFVFKKIFTRWEVGTKPDDAYDKVLASIDKLNKQILFAQKKFNVINIVNPKKFNSELEQCTTIILHTVEGCHHLGSHSNDPQHYIDHLKVLKQKGVCSITISHFFPNAVCDSGGGVPPATAKLVGYELTPHPNPGLTAIGIEVVKWCQENGMIICLKHSSIATRYGVYKILEDRRSAGLPTVPVTFTHAGIRELAAPNMSLQRDKDVLPDIEELRIIKKFDGIIGLILMNYWLIGIEEDSITTIDNATPHILRSIQFLKENLGDFENIGIGTDLDGFTQVPDDLRHIRFLKNLAFAIEENFGTDVARKICFENAKRVLLAGWK